jgi:hypothetical protein
MDPTTNDVFVAWMPYFTVAYSEGHSKEIAIGKARLLPDDDDSWRSVTGGDRPKFLEIHRDFPTLLADGLAVGQPLRGTLIYSDDAEWLQEHLDSLTAVVFMLATTEHQPLPAECFTTYPFHLKPRTKQTDDDLAGYFTKHGQAIESSQVLNLTPPLAVRARLKDRRLFTHERWAAALLDLFASAPYDRLIVATRQYFRSQFSDFFTSPPDEDDALHCSALEAALGIPREKSSADHFARELGERFKISPLSETFFLGLYVARSRYVHGAPGGTPLDQSAKETAALELFEGTVRKRWLMRTLTREVIETALSANPPAGAPRFATTAECLLRQCLGSDGIWQRAKRLLTCCGAAQRIIAMTDEEFSEVVTIAADMRKSFHWHDVREQPDHGVLCKTLRTCAIVLGALTQSTGRVYEHSNRIGLLADGCDAQGLEQWIHEDPWHNVWPNRDNRVTILQSLTRSITKAFDRLGLVRD